MNIKTVCILAAAAVLLLTSQLNASITSWVCSDDNDGAIVMNDTLTSLTYDSGLDEYTLSMEGASIGIRLMWRANSSQTVNSTRQSGLLRPSITRRTLRGLTITSQSE